MGIGGGHLQSLLPGEIYATEITRIDELAPPPDMAYPSARRLPLQMSLRRVDLARAVRPHPQKQATSILNPPDPER
jgi:hypothetical protein